MSLLKTLINKILGSDTKNETVPTQSSPAKKAHEKGGSNCCGGCGGETKKTSPDKIESK